MQTLRRVWEHLEEGFIAFLLAAMTLVTFVYVMLNNIYTLFFSLADKWLWSSNFFNALGDHTMTWAQDMTWSVALTKAMFGWLIFLPVSSRTTLCVYPACRLQPGLSSPDISSS